MRRRIDDVFKTKMIKSLIGLQNMNNIHKPEYTKNKIIHVFFIWSGAKFFMDWILPSNDSSKNPIFRVLWLYYWRHKKPISPQNRLNAAYIYASIHILGLFASIMLNKFGWADIFVNIYPIVINAYIGCRCKAIILWRRSLVR